MLRDLVAVPLSPYRNCKAIRSNPSGKLLVVCTTEGVAPVFSTQQRTGDGRVQQVGTLSGHEGPILSVREPAKKSCPLYIMQAGFAPLGFGSLCATGGMDCKVIIHKEAQGGAGSEWSHIYMYVTVQMLVLCYM